MIGATGSRARSIAVSVRNAAATAAKIAQKSLELGRSTLAAARPAAPVAMNRMDVQLAHRKTGCATSRRGSFARSPTADATAPDSGPRTAAAKTNRSDAIDA